MNLYQNSIIGDAYGAGFEFKNSMLIHNDAQKFYNHPTHMASDGSGNSLRVGQYTDDTQMSIAVAETLLGDDYSKLAFADSFTRCFHRDPRKGYASGFYGFLLKTKTGKEFLQNILPNSDKNGAAMRSVPLGFLPTPEEVIEVATTQASITHATPGGIDSSIIVGLASWYLMHNPDKDGLISFIEHKVPGYNLSETWVGYVPCHGISTAKAALSVLMSTNSMKEALIKSVALGGDTDSVASITLGLLDCYSGRDDDLPRTLLTTCEQGNYGLDYCIELEEVLFNKQT